MGHRHTGMHRTTYPRHGYVPFASADFDTRSILLQRLQSFIETSRDQFDERDLDSTDWRAADDALECVYAACAKRQPITQIEQLCHRAHRYIEAAVETSALQSYYDGRL